MLLHFAPVSPSEEQSLVGQYHSGRIIPLVLGGLAAMLNGILMSYMTASWERGDKKQVVSNCVGLSNWWAWGSSVGDCHF